MKLAKLNSITEQHIVGSVYNMFSCFTETSFAQVFLIPGAANSLFISMLFAGALRCCPGQPCEICVHPSPKEGMACWTMFHSKKYRFHMINSTYTSIPHSLFTTNGNIFKRYLFPKASFLPSQKKMYFQILGKVLQRTL